MTKSPRQGRTVVMLAVAAAVLGGGLYACRLSPSCPLAALMPTYERTLESNLNNDLQGDLPMSAASSHTHTPGQVEHASTADFQQKVLSSDVPVLVDFYADWCGPCKMLAPTLEALAKESPNARVVKVNVDHSPELAMQYGVSAIPSIAVFKDGEIVAEHVGLASKSQLQAMLQQ